MKREVEVFDNWIRRDNYLQSTENLQNRLQNIHKGPSDPNLPMGEIDWAFFFVGNPHVSLSVPQGVIKGRFDEEGSRARFHHDRLGRTRHGTTRSASEEMHKRVIEFFLTQQARGGWRCTSC